MDWLVVSPWLLAGLFLVAVLAGFIDTLAGGCVGFYNNLFGPGAGSFYALAFVMLSGYNLATATATATATAHAKILDFTSNFGGLMLFVLSGKVIWAIGLVMLAGQILGARLGARMVLARWQQLIRPIIVEVSLLMSIKLIYDNHGAAIAHWLAVWL